MYNTDYLTKDIKYRKKDQVFCWVSNLCFSDNLTNNIYLKLLKTLPKHSVICSSKIPSGITNVNKYKVPMSWDKDSSVKIYKVV